MSRSLTITAKEAPPGIIPVHRGKRKTAELYMLGDDTTGKPMTPREISEIVGVTSRTVRVWLRSDDKVCKYVEYLAEGEVTLAKVKLKRAASGAVDRLVKLSKTARKDTAPRIRAATEILDRAGAGATRHYEHSGPGGGPIPVLTAIVDAYQVRRNRDPVIEVEAE